MSAELVVLMLGSLLVMIGIIGGGFEIKELKVPQVGGMARLVSGAAGAVLLVVGIGMKTEAVNNKSPTDPPTPTSIAFSLFDQLGEDQISEQVRVLINGRDVGTLSVSQQRPSASLTVSVPKAGQYSYMLAADAVFRDGSGRHVRLSGVGQGQIEVSDRKRFQLSGGISGDTWIATVEEM